VDVLTDLLQRSRARGAAFSRTTVYGRWGLRFPAGAGLAVHAIVDGEVWLWVNDPEHSLRLLPGDVVLVREATEHHVAHLPGAPCLALEQAIGPGTGVSRRVALGDPEQGSAASFFCGAYRFEGDLCDGLLAALPETLRVRPSSGSTLRATMDLLAREMLEDEPGQQAMLDRLLDVALVQILREHFMALQTAAPGWFRASADPRIGTALRALHANPERQWTVAELAERALLSRSAFARHFSELLGVAPLTYLVDWRMALARERLRDTDAGLATIAESLGYASAFSFAAAFKRHHGTAPGRWRSRTRAAVASAGATAQVRSSS
jgi:AraC-like DNA-binding protein